MQKNKFKTMGFAAMGLATICLFARVAPLCAQTVSGTILGVIQDQQGAIVANADVSARNLETGAVRNTTADDSGNYRISSVPAGSYEISASKAGFKTEVRNGVVVTVGADVSVTFSLSVGAVSDKVEVTGEAAQVDTASSTLSGFVDSATIRELPLNGRDWIQLALLQPGVSLNEGQNQTDASRTARGIGLAISISGGRSTDNAFLVDGVIVNDATNAGPGSSLRVNLGVDAIREFSVLTNNYSAEYGRGSGGVINAITKSGTNEIHGSAYEFVRNSAFDARNFFDGQNIPPFRRDQYGGAMGGAIKKDKTFYFVNYEKLGELQSLSSSFTTPSANAHNGILCANTACTQTTQIAINPKVLPYLALYPLPNSTVSGNAGNFAYGAPRHGEENYVVGKIDHYLSSSTILTASYTFDKADLTDTDNYDLMVGAYPSTRQIGVLNLQHIFSPSLINVTRAAISRTYEAQNLSATALNPALADPSLGFLPGLAAGEIKISGVTGIYGGVGSGLAPNGPGIFALTTPQFNDDLSWTKGRQNIRMGFSFQRLDDNIYNPASGTNGIWTFASIQTFLQGIPTQFQGQLPTTSAYRSMRMSVIAGYLQDNIRLGSNLTINLGLRYEMGTSVSEAHGRIANLRNLTDPTVTVGGPYYNNPSLKNFAPRVGFSWDPFKDGKTAIRGGAGIFDIVPLPYLFDSRITQSAPYFISGTVVNPPPSSFPNNILSLLSAPTAAAATHVEFNPPPSYKVQWNFNIQRQLTNNIALTVGYVGSSGVHLAHVITDADQVPPSLVTFNTAEDAFNFPIPAKGTAIQRINPNFGSIGSTDWTGHSSYHALQANLVQRLKKGLTYQIAYTWSKSIDNGSSTFNDGNETSNGSPSPWAFDPRINRGPSDFNVPQAFVANFLYDVPVPGAINRRAFTHILLGGWQVGGIYTRQSGAPFTLKIATDVAFTGNSAVGANNGGQRPMYVNAPGCTPDAVTGNISNYIMTQCFAYPLPGELGNLGRNTTTMPVFRDLDFSVFKNDNLWGEKLKMQFRVEMFNILNNTNLEAQTITLYDGTGAVIPSALQPHAPTANTSRQIQFGLRLSF